MKKILAILVCMTLVAMMPMALGDTTDTAEIEVELDPEGDASISVTPTTHEFAGAIGAVIATTSGTFTVSNDGTVSVLLEIEGEDCGVGVDDWTIETTQGFNQFTIEYKNESFATWELFVDAKENFLCNSAGDDNELPVDATRDFDLRAGLATSSSSTQSQFFTVTLTGTPVTA